MKRIILSIPEELLQKIDTEAKAQIRSRNGQIRHMLEMYIEKG